MIVGSSPSKGTVFIPAYTNAGCYLALSSNSASRTTLYDISGEGYFSLLYILGAAGNQTVWLTIDGIEYTFSLANGQARKLVGMLAGSDVDGEGYLPFKKSAKIEIQSDGTNSQPVYIRYALVK